MTREEQYEHIEKFNRVFYEASGFKEEQQPMMFCLLTTGTWDFVFIPFFGDTENEFKDTIAKFFEVTAQNPIYEAVCLCLEGWGLKGNPGENLESVKGRLKDKAAEREEVLFVFFRTPRGEEYVAQMLIDRINQKLEPRELIDTSKTLVHGRFFKKEVNQ